MTILLLQRKIARRNWAHADLTDQLHSGDPYSGSLAGRCHVVVAGRRTVAGVVAVACDWGARGTTVARGKAQAKLG